jgi:hypothetical protein
MLDKNMGRFIQNEISEETMNDIKGKILSKKNNRVEQIVEFHNISGFFPWRIKRWFNLPVFSHFFQFSKTDCGTPDVDVCVATRKREHDDFRNYSNWKKIVDLFVRRKIKVAILGKKETTQQIEGISCYSYDYGGVDACVDILKKSKLFITTDTGLAHLNNFTETPMLILSVPGWRGEPEILGINKNTKKFYAPNDCWNNVDIFLDYIREVLETLNIKRRINLEMMKQQSNKVKTNTIRSHPNIKYE